MEPLWKFYNLKNTSLNPKQIHWYILPQNQYYPNDVFNKRIPDLAENIYS